MKEKPYYEYIDDEGNNVVYKGVIDYFNERIRIDSFNGNGEELVEMMDKLAIKIGGYETNHTS